MILLRLLHSVFGSSSHPRVTPYIPSRSSFSHLDLPDIMFVLFITRWLSLNEFVILDSALCNRFYRKRILLIIKRQHTVFAFKVCRDMEFYLRRMIFDWLVDKRIGIDTIEIKIGNLPNVWSTLCKTNSLLKTSLYNRVKYLEVANYLNKPDIKVLTKLFPVVKSLTVNYIYIEAVIHLSQFNKLSELIIANCNNATMLAIAKCCPQLTSFGFTDDSYTRYSCCELTEKVMVTACKQFEDLVKFNINWRAFTGDCLYAILAAHDNPFQKLCFKHCTEVNVELLLKIASTSAQSLTHLEIIPATTEVSGESQFCCENTSEGFRILLNACVKLTHVCVRGQPNCLGNGILNVNRHMKYLDLSLCECSDTTCGSIAQAYYNVQHLNLYQDTESQRWNSVFMVGSVGILSLAKSLRNLTHLDLGSASASTIHNVEIGALVRANPLLRTLLLSHRVSNLDALNTAVVASRISLTKVDLSHCSELTDNDLVALSHASPELTSLNLTRCVLLTDVTLNSLSEHCPKLWCLKIIDCPRFGLEGIMQIRKSCKKLTKLTHF